MGMNASIICTGPFDKSIADCLDYDVKDYENVLGGRAVASNLLCCNTSEQSRQLAKALGTEAWDFDTHCVISDKVKWVDLYELEKDDLHWEQQVYQLKRLLDAGFTCIYMPNG